MLIGPNEYIEAGVLDTLARHCAPKGTPDQWVRKHATSLTVSDNTQKPQAWWSTGSFR